jgi:hypothetical protein
MKIFMKDIKRMTRKTLIKQIIDFFIVPQGF